MVGPFIALATGSLKSSQNEFLLAIYERFQFSSESQFLLMAGSVIVLVFYAKAFLSFNAQRYIFEFGFGQQAELSARLMQAHLAAPYTFHLTQNSASLIDKIINETDRFANGLMMPLLTSIANSIVIFALVGLLVRTNVSAVIIIGLVLIIGFAFIYFLKGWLSRWGKDLSEARTEMIRTINHALGGLKETKVIGCEAYFEAHMQAQVEKFGRSAALATSFSNLPRFMIEAFLMTFLIIFTVLFVSSNQSSAENLSSVLGIFALASIRLLPAVSNLLSSINTVRFNTFALDQIYLDFKELSNYQELRETGSKRTSVFPSHHSDSFNALLPFIDCISLKNITYQYPGACRNSLENISLTIAKGQSIGLIGKSGAGKTTLVDIILGLLTPQTGDILVDGVSIYQNLRSWQNIIGYVPQSIFLVDDTLEKNIAFGVPDHLIDSERLQKAIYLAQLSELVDQLPQGTQTVVGERGVLLSGGQRQRVGIARALYHEREILVFDEATAALDNETESLVTEAIKSLSGVKTMIIIAHRLSTIEHCDRIYMLGQGQIIGAGGYTEVALRDSKI